MMMSTALNRSLMAAVRNSGKKSMSRYLSTVEVDANSKAKDSVDPMEIFDSIDTNGDGVLSKEEFQVAVEKMHYVSNEESLLRNQIIFATYRQQSNDISLISII